MNAIKSAKFVQKNLYFRQRFKDTIEYQIAHICVCSRACSAQVLRAGCVQIICDIHGPQSISYSAVNLLEIKH